MKEDLEKKWKNVNEQAHKALENIEKTGTE